MKGKEKYCEMSATEQEEQKDNGTKDPPTGRYRVLPHGLQ